MGDLVYSHRASLNIQIVLSRDKEGENIPTDIPVYYCGDQISGYLRAVTSYDLYFEVILSFEGLSEAFINLDLLLIVI